MLLWHRKYAYGFLIVDGHEVGGEKRAPPNADRRKKPSKPAVRIELAKPRLQAERLLPVVQQCLARGFCKWQ